MASRNLGLVGHSGCGKTTLAEAILFNTKETTRFGKVDDGTSTMDFEPEEINKKISLVSSFHPFSWKNGQFNLIDTPGENDFLSDAKICLSAAEIAVVVVDAVDGVKVGTNKVWSFCDNLNIPRLFFINKVDRERADFFRVLDDLESAFGVKATPVYLPIGSENNFSGLADLIDMKAYIYPTDGSGTPQEGDIPGEMEAEAKQWREKMIENIVEADDSLMEKYLDGQDVSQDEIRNALKSGVKSGTVMPVVPGSAARNIGIDRLLELIDATVPKSEEKGKIEAHRKDSEETVEINTGENAPFTALVFKTIADPFTGQISIFKVMSGKISSDSAVYNSTRDLKEKFGQLLAIRGKKQTPVSSVSAGDIAAVAKLKGTKTGDTFCQENDKIVFKPVDPLPSAISLAVEAEENEDKVYSSLVKMTEEDPTLKIDRDQSTSEIILSGTGQNHLDYIRDKLKRKFGVEITLATPKIPYRETIKKSVENVEYKHKKQSGGRGQFAVVFFDVSPRERGEGYEFDMALTGTNVPRNFVPAVEKGVDEAMQSGILAGYPVVDVCVRFFDGKSHDVDSSEMAFKTAAIMCFKKAMQDAAPVLIEPIMNMEIMVPDDAVGDVMGDLNGRRGKVLGTDSKGKYQIIKAEAPLAEVQKYAFDLTSLTGGRGSFTMERVRYEEVPSHLAEKVIAAAKKAREEE